MANNNVNIGGEVVLPIAIGASKAYTDKKVSEVRNKFEVYNSYSDLPAVGDANTIYLVPTGTDNVYDQYIYDTDTGYYVDIGDTNIDLASKMNVNNPVGTGSFSMNRKANTTVGEGSFTAGIQNEASGQSSHAVGGGNVVSGNNSHAEGFGNTVSGNEAHAEGIGNIVSGNNAHAEGHFNKASSDSQHVQGKFNIEDNAGVYADIVGWGSSGSNRANIETLKTNGDFWVAGDIEDGNGNTLSGVAQGLSDAEEITDNFVVENGKLCVVVTDDGNGNATTENEPLALDSTLQSIATAMEEIADKIDDVAEASVVAAAEDWLEENVDPSTGYVIDSSLSVQNAAADAKKTGDEITSLRSALSSLQNIQNLFNISRLVPNYTYNTSASSNSNYSYFVVEVTSGTTYKFGCKTRYISKSGTNIYSDKPKGFEYTADFTGDLYVTVYNNVAIGLEWSMCESTVDIDTIGTYQHRTLSPYVMGQAYTGAKSGTLSQFAIDKHANDVVNTIRNDDNVFNHSVFYENKYYNTSLSSNTIYSVFKVEVVANTEYRFMCRCRFISKTGEVLKENTAVNSTYTPTYSGVMYVTVYNSLQSDERLVMCESSKDAYACGIYGNYTLSPYILAQTSGTDKSKAVSQYLLNKELSEKGLALSKGYSRQTGDLSDGDSLTISSTTCKKNNVYSFNCKVTSFDTLLIGSGKTNFEASYITVDNTNLTVTRYSNSATTETFAHGLTISDYLAITITVKEGKADIVIFSNGSQFKQANVDWWGDAGASYYVESDNSTLTDCVFTWSSDDFRKYLWVFGDSYVSYFSGAIRWTYYLQQDGYLGDIMLAGYGGEDSNNARAVFDHAKSFGKPKMLVWALGMNDRSDSGDTPSTIWMNNINIIKQYCDNNGIALILCTIPSVPNINHEAKNTWVRTSGYRYIDFAEAVGAQSNGTWYTGMLSSDNIHPTELGAKALYRRAIADCPELTFKND